MAWILLLACIVACVILADYYQRVGNRRGVILCGVALLVISAVVFALYLYQGEWRREPSAFDEVREQYGYLDD